MARIIRKAQKYDKKAKCIGMYLHSDTDQNPEGEGNDEYKKFYGHLTNFACDRVYNERQCAMSLRRSKVKTDLLPTPVPVTP